MPSYDKVANRWRRGESATRPSAVLTTVTGTDTGPAFDTAAADTVEVTVTVTAVAVSPSMTVKVQTSDDGTTGWTDLAPTSAAITTVSTTRFRANGAGRFSRVVHTMTGAGASATFTTTAVGK